MPGSSPENVFFVTQWLKEKRSLVIQNLSVPYTTYLLPTPVHHSLNTLHSTQVQYLLLSSLNLLLTILNCAVFVVIFTLMRLTVNNLSVIYLFVIP